MKYTWKERLLTDELLHQDGLRWKKKPEVHASHPQTPTCLKDYLPVPLDSSFWTTANPQFFHKSSTLLLYPFLHAISLLLTYHKAKAKFFKQGKSVKGQKSTHCSIQTSILWQLWTYNEWLLPWLWLNLLYTRQGKADMGATPPSTPSIIWPRWSNLWKY